jgi:glyoxylase-like metal-dependent hydrolase (beta-lactamase superfamily II)
MRQRFARWRSPVPEVRAWVDRDPGHAVVAIARDPRVLQIKTPRGNGYLVLGDTVTAIDPNMPGEEALFARALEGEGRTLGDIDYVTCTHLHFDHASGLDTLAEAADARLVLPSTMRRFVDGDDPYPWPSTRRSAWPFVDVWGRVGFPMIRRRQMRGGEHIGYHWSDFSVRSEVARWFEDGEPLPEMGGLVALHTPGHCEEHTCFLHEASGTLLAGDMYITIRGYVETNRIVLDTGQRTSSDKRLRALGVEHVWPGHGPAMDLEARHP